MAWGSEEEKRKFAIGALFGSEFMGSLGGGFKNTSSTVVNGSFVGWDEPISTIKKTYCSEYVEKGLYDKHPVSYGFMQDVIFNTLSLAKLKYSFERYIEDYNDTQYAVGVKIFVSADIEIRFYMASDKASIDQKGVYGVSRNAEDGITVYYRTYIKGVFVGSASIFLTSNSAMVTYNDKIRFEISISYFGFDDNGFLWMSPIRDSNTQTIILPFNDNVFLSSGGLFYDQDNTQTYTLVSNIYLNTTEGEFPTLVTYCDTTTEKAKEKCSSIIKPSIKGANDSVIIPLDNVGLTLMNNTKSKSIKMTLIDNDEKYLYFYRYDGKVLLINKGTFN